MKNLRTLSAVLVLIFGMMTVRAQDYSQPGYTTPDQANAADNQADPPSRVARISVLNGNVSFEPASVNEFSPAEVNYPLTTGDRLYSDAGALTELEAGGIAVRLGQQTDLTVTALTDTLAQFGLEQGSVHVRPFTLDQGSVTEIDTPNAAISFEQPGDVRIDVSPDQDTTIVTVAAGAVMVTADGVQQELTAGQSFRIRGANPAAADYVRRARMDALDNFSSERDAQYLQAIAADGGYVNADTIGAADLAQAGDWATDDVDDGPVWYPRGVAVDWTPYREGHWAWIAPWGWTWVEAEPWGFTPFHYGRWIFRRNRWGWIAGPPVVRPIYSPALVVFVGGGGVGFTGWFPLGPREPFVPWYHARPSYINRINVTNIYNHNTIEVRNIYNNRTQNVYAGAAVNVRYANRNVAVTAMAQDRFAAGRPVHGNRIEGNAQQLAQAPILPHPVVTPTHSIVAPAPARVQPPVMARPVLVNHGRPETGGFRVGQPVGQPPSQPANLPSPVRTGPAAPPVRGGPVRAPGPMERPVTPVETQPAQQPAPQQPTPMPAPLPRPIVGRPAQQTQPLAPAQIAPAQQTAAPGIRTSQPRSYDPRQQQTVAPQQTPAQPRPLVNQATPPPARPNFDRQRQAMENSDPGRPLSPQQMDNVGNNRAPGPHNQAEPPHPTAPVQTQPVVRTPPVPVVAPRPAPAPRAQPAPARPEPPQKDNKKH